MAGSSKPQRVRDPVHNLIEFDGTDQFEQVMWRVIQTGPFQRLRRIKQLGFSELVYPGATHTRFAHCIGVFHTARQLMKIIERDIRSTEGSLFQDNQARVAVAAALVHDLGHGMFSHAFEDVGKRSGLAMARHEDVSGQLICEGEVSDVLTKEMGSGFANDVADVIKSEEPKSLYNAVVSSQFDADRLDYMRRDRLLTGVQNSGIDFTWLIHNLEVGAVNAGVDDAARAEVPTFVIGPKAISAAETYVLSLFQLYPTVYFHKATRSAEKMFSALMSRVIELVRVDLIAKTGLSMEHQLVKFIRDPKCLDNVLALDDTVFWSSLPLMSEADDPLIEEFSARLWKRDLRKCVDVRERLLAANEEQPPDEGVKRLKRLSDDVADEVQSWSDANSQHVPRVLIDRTERKPYKRFEGSKGPLNQILVRTTSGGVRDLAEFSTTVAGIEKFQLFRVYVDRDDHEAKSVIDASIDNALRRNVDVE
ncbi:MAG: hypothetical protein Tsb0020_37610 [Haliangiales bacterium]